MIETCVAVIGAGPAGAAAAVQLSRQGTDLLLIEKARVGGLLRHANLVENYPGFPGGIRGSDLADRIEEQLAGHSVVPLPETVLSLSWRDDCFHLVTEGEEVRAEYVIVASGTRANQFDSALISGLSEDHILADPTALSSITGAHIIVIGGGDAAFDYALNASGRGNRVTILSRSGFHCLSLLAKRAEAVPEITCHAAHRILRIAPGKEQNCELLCSCKGSRVLFQSDYVLPAIGRCPELSFFDSGLIPSGCEEALKNRLIFAGDVHNGRFRHAAIAAGEGVRAALIVHEQLSKHNGIQ